MGEFEEMYGGPSRPGSIAKERDRRFKRRLVYFKKQCPNAKINKNVKSALSSLYIKKYKAIIRSCKKSRN